MKKRAFLSGKARFVFAYFFRICKDGLQQRMERLASAKLDEAFFGACDGTGVHFGSRQLTIRPFDSMFAAPERFRNHRLWRNQWKSI